MAAKNTWYPWKKPRTLLRSSCTGSQVKTALVSFRLSFMSWKFLGRSRGTAIDTRNRDRDIIPPGHCKIGLLVTTTLQISLRVITTLLSLDFSITATQMVWFPIPLLHIMRHYQRFLNSAILYHFILLYLFTATQYIVMQMFYSLANQNANRFLQRLRHTAINRNNDLLTRAN